LHYGMIDMGHMASLRADGAYRRCIRDFLEFAGMFATTAQGAEKTAIGQFLAAAQKRFGRFARRYFRVCDGGFGAYGAGAKMGVRSASVFMLMVSWSLWTLSLTLPRNSASIMGSLPN
jgi:hypothetical protein